MGNTIKDEIKGWVYIISNKAMPGLLKIGYSTKDPSMRALELNHTGSPYPYEVEYELLIKNPFSLEQKVHRHLKHKQEGKEWFRCSLEDAISSIKFCVDNGLIIYENSREKFKLENSEKFNTNTNAYESNNSEEMYRQFESPIKIVTFKKDLFDADPINHILELISHNPGYTKALLLSIDTDSAEHKIPNFDAELIKNLKEIYEIDNFNDKLSATTDKQKDYHKSKAHILLRSIIKRRPNIINLKTFETYFTVKSSNSEDSIDGQFHGQGKLMLESGYEFDGDFENGVPHGNGTLKSPDGIIYNGKFKDGEPYGKLQLIFPDGEIIEGDFLEGKVSGQGVHVKPDEEKYVGDFIDGQYHGKGTWNNSLGDQYSGEFVNGKPNGKGFFTNHEGYKCVGKWEDSHFLEGEVSFPDGTKYIGEFLRDNIRQVVFSGKGTIMSPNGEKYYGEFREGEYHGNGTLIYTDGKQVAGQFKDGIYLGLQE